MIDQTHDEEISISLKIQKDSLVFYTIYEGNESILKESPPLFDKEQFIKDQKKQIEDNQKLRAIKNANEAAEDEKIMKDQMDKLNRLNEEQKVLIEQNAKFYEETSIPNLVGNTGYKKIQNPLIVVLPVMVFILIGAEHCVADMFYWLEIRRPFTIIPLLVITLGNAVGGNVIEYITTKDEKLC